MFTDLMHEANINSALWSDYVGNMEEVIWRVEVHSVAAHYTDATLISFFVGKRKIRRLTAKKLS